MNVTVSAVDVEGNVIGGFAGRVDLSLVLEDGTLQPVTPVSVNLSGETGWTGTITFPGVDAAPLRLRAADSNGNFGDSIAFDIMRVLNLTAGDLAWDPTRSQLYASVPASAGGSNANQVIVIDPVNVRISSSVLTGQDSGQLALTGGGENLYVALNGNGRIARINPTTMTVASTFAVGTSPAYGALYAADMCTVAGQPDLLVVSQKRTSVIPEHNGVAVYDHGVVRPNKTQEHTGSNVIEPSAYDPTTFSNIRRMTLPSVMTSARSFIRWGTNGLAFRTDTNIVLIRSSQLVPSDPSANLAVTVEALPNPATVSQPLTYTLCVSNQGPNIARSTILAATLSDSQTIQSVVASA
ncbi:MAG: hypothetical protein E6L09_13900, partial [Verrucomicrobia bacterium]